MRAIYILLILTLQTSFGQNLDFNKFKFKGLNFYTSKAKIIQKLGVPNREFQPNYDCGGLSSAWQGVNYFSIEYGNVKFTGNENEKYLIEQVDFEKDESVFLLYGKHRLHSETSLKELSEIFGKQINDRINKCQLSGEFSVHHHQRDDGIILEIKNEKLVRFKYWTSC